MEIFPNIRNKTKRYKAVRLEHIYINSDGMEKILDCVNSRAMICHSGIDELNPIEKLAFEILAEANNFGG